MFSFPSKDALITLSVVIMCNFLLIYTDPLCQQTCGNKAKCEQRSRSSNQMGEVARHSEESVALSFASELSTEHKLMPSRFN